MDEFLHRLDWVLPLRSEAVTPLIEGLTELGHAPLFIFLLPILYWTWNPQATNRVAVLLLVSALLNLFLKDLFQDPRPEAYFLEGQSSESYGFPSGHTQLSIVFWLALAIEIGKRWFWILASLLVVGIAFSRLYLGVHDVEDVIGGAFVGGMGLLVYQIVRHRWKGIPPRTRFGFAGLATVLLLLLIVFWPHQIAVPDMAFLLCGFLAGWAGGAWRERQRGGFERLPGIPRSLISVILGLIGIAGVAAILKFGLEGLVDSGRLPDAIAILFGGWAVGFFITFLAPRFFLRAGLMQESKR